VSGIRVAVLGAAGRMGQQVCGAIEAAADLALVARVDVGDRRESLVESGAQVAVDLTHPDAVLDNVRYCVGAGVHCVVGTSGFTPERLAVVREVVDAAPGVGVLVAPNFSLGAVLMMRFAAEAARFFESVEIIESHHPDKLDAPSGTALRTASLIGAARKEAGLGAPPDATASALDGARGASVDGVAVHSVRARGVYARQEVLLGNTGETLTIRHDSPDRLAFMPGILLGVRRVGSMPGLTVGLEHVLGLD
jgi:4-hydroxy-tetrahydrodipicolinate reductase